ncbi:MAG: RiPP maturation radical SAM C-methyltransferase [Deltaproteobacteria bacterium]|nr:RiPP maturation radical SAM C-methyltransferase [Deltaproteobacteria bacterium]
MLRIALVNMPFASIHRPSIALTQLKEVIGMEFPDEAEVKIFYPNVDFAEQLGVELYIGMANSVEANTTGLGDWFFRQAAFPDLEDNSDAYLQRHFAEHRQQIQLFGEHLRKEREELVLRLEELIDKYQLDQYDLVGFTTMFSQNVASFALMRLLKARNPEIVTVMGGANCETPMGQILVKNFPYLDFVFSGPSLVSFPQFVGHLIRGDEEKCHDIVGVFSRPKLEAKGAVTEVGKELDLEVDILVDYDDFYEVLDERKLVDSTDTHILFETSRGCWWGERSHCTFCGLNGLTMKYRSMSPEKALAQFQRLFDKYGDRSPLFESVDNILPREYFTDVLPKLETPENVSLFYEIKADLKEHEMEALAKARVTRIQPGIEALNTGTLKLMGKGTTSFQNLRFLKYCMLYDVEPFWNLLVGFPGEGEEVYAKYVEDMPLLTHMPPPSGSYPVRFDRFSPYFNSEEKYGIKLRPCEFYKLIYPFPEEDFFSMAYFFIDENYGAEYITNTAKWIGKLRGQIDYWHRRWNQADNLLKPELFFKGEGEGRTVYDSRNGRAVEHRLNPLQLLMLDSLEKPLRANRLIKRLPDDVSEARLSEDLEELKERGLLFEERELLMNLVLERSSTATVNPVILNQSDAAETFDFA